MNVSRRALVPLAALLALLALLAPAVPAGAVELLTNGDLESFTFISPDNWGFTPGAPGSGPDAVVVSPFTNVYPGSTASMLLTDINNVDLTPILGQSFAAQTGQITYSAEFRLGPLSGSPTFLAFSGNHPTAGLSTAFLFTIDNINHELVADGFATAATVATLSPNVWYQLSGTADVVTHTFSGTLTPFGGSPIPFGPLGWNSFLVDLRRVEISDSFSAGMGGTFQNADLYVDNFSVTPEPGAVTGVLLAGAMLLRRRR